MIYVSKSNNDFLSFPHYRCVFFSLGTCLHRGMVKLSVLSFHETRSSIYMAKPSPDQQFEVECKFIAIC